MAIEDEVGALAVAEKAGRATGLRQAVEDLCEVLGIELTPERRTQIAGMGADALDALRAALKKGRTWPAR